VQRAIAPSATHLPGFTVLQIAATAISYHAATFHKIASIAVLLLAASDPIAECGQ